MPPAVVAPRRVVVKFRRTIELPYDATASQKLQQNAGVNWAGFLITFPGVRFQPLDTATDINTLRAFDLLTPAVGGTPFAFTSFFVITCPPGTNVAGLLDAVRAWPNVEMAYEQAQKVPPPVAPDDDDLFPDQGYLAPAPAGIGARWVWDVATTDGTGVGFVDMEQGWILNHEDLAGAVPTTPIWGLNHDYKPHGTAILGIVRGIDNDVGVVGVAPQCTARVISEWEDLPTPVRAVSTAIRQAVTVMAAGDVLLLEAQYGVPDMLGIPQPPWLPVETEYDVYDAIRLAVTKGIIVIEPAANGQFPTGVDLDTFTVAGITIFNPLAPMGMFRNSGAIMVGGATGSVPHVKLDHFNTGGRVDCFAWGQGVVTTWQRDASTLLNEYHPAFAGTSAAAAIVAGAAVLLQAWRIGRGKPRYTPAEMQALLRMPYNTDSEHPTTDNIGKMPNLRAIITAELAIEQTNRRREFLAAARQTNTNGVRKSVWKAIRAAARKLP